MTADTTQCVRCRSAVDSGTLCDHCCGEYEQAAADLIVLLPHLETAVAGLDNVALGIVHRPAQVVDDADWLRVRDGRIIPAHLRSKHGRIALPATALPVNLDASALLDDVRRKLRGWVAHLARTAPAPKPTFGPTCTACRHNSCVHTRLERARWTDRTVCLWLLRNTPLVRVDSQAGAIVADLLTARRKIERAIDSREPELYVGPCDAPDVALAVRDDGTWEIATDRICGVDLYATLGATTVECQACGYSYRIAERRAYMLDAVREVWARPALIAASLTSMGLPLTAGRLDQWISRDKRRHARCPAGDPCGCILQVARDTDDVDDQGKPLGKPLYRVGAVMDRLATIRQATIEATS